MKNFQWDNLEKLCESKKSKKKKSKMNRIKPTCSTNLTIEEAENMETELKEDEYDDIGVGARDDEDKYKAYMNTYV